MATKHTLQQGTYPPLQYSINNNINISIIWFGFYVIPTCVDHIIKLKIIKRKQSVRKLSHTALAQQFIARSVATIATFLLLSSTASAFTDIEGKKVELEKQLGGGKWSIVEIWASDCHACRQHMPSMVKFDGKLDNARIVGITLDGQEGIDDAKAMIKEYGMKFTNVVSNPIEVNAWMLKNVGEPLIGTPTMMIFDAEGKLAAAQPGPVKVESLETFIKENAKVETTDTTSTDKKSTETEATDEEVVVTEKL